MDKYAAITATLKPSHLQSVNPVAFLVQIKLQEHDEFSTVAQRVTKSVGLLREYPSRDQIYNRQSCSKHHVCDWCRNKPDMCGTSYCAKH